MAERIEVPVPEGFPPMCEPVKAENRAESVFVVPASDKYLAAMVRGIRRFSYLRAPAYQKQAESFERSYPEAILDSITKSTREIEHTAKRLSATLKAPNVTMLIATLGDNGLFMGCAAFLKAGRMPNEHHMHIFQPAAFHQGHNFKKLMGWTDKEVDEMHSGINMGLLEEMMERTQLKREELMGNQLYVMLGPIWVSNEYRSRGVGSKLVYEGFKMSRDAGVPLLLSGVFPNAAPAYLHLGFERLEGCDDLMIWWPQGIARRKVEGDRLVY